MRSDLKQIERTGAPWMTLASCLLAVLFATNSASIGWTISFIAITNKVTRRFVPAKRTRSFAPQKNRTLPFPIRLSTAPL